MPTPGPATEPPPVHLQPPICERRARPDEVRSTPIRRDRFLHRNNADTLFDLVRTRLQPGAFVVLRRAGTDLRLVRHPNAPES